MAKPKRPIFNFGITQPTTETFDTEQKEQLALLAHKIAVAVEDAGPAGHTALTKGVADIVQSHIASTDTIHEETNRLSVSLESHAEKFTIKKKKSSCCSSCCSFFFFSPNKKTNSQTDLLLQSDPDIPGPSPQAMKHVSS